MKTTQSLVKYIKWLSAEEMHADSVNWLSELNFTKDEHLFFEHLITSFTMELLELKYFASDKEIVDAINRSEKQNDLLLASVTAHEQQLKIMVDEIDELKEEETYKETHRKLTIEIHQFLEDYRMLKAQLFDIIKGIKKEQKQRYLLDKNH
ncbi:hypothetical protein IMCC3317_09990 [Kordia antarctica]|uniref:Uncharacterized protein n=1 Tax=Kordia antarctica TaxID=1218801 RepID=A0A7L4ZG30_9FLAO|nr:hypothetical protein [Kordia antarctica]QHI35653.1 hypothetical protein IMCC3317_09990 [Kordia antarctica]